MKACGNIPPINIKSAHFHIVFDCHRELNAWADKDKFIGKERLRWARLFDVPMHESVPPGFPKNTLPAERALTAVSMFYPEKMEETFATLYHASFVEHQDVVDKDILLALLAQIHGEDRAKNMMAKVRQWLKKILPKLTSEQSERFGRSEEGASSEH